MAPLERFARTGRPVGELGEIKTEIIDPNILVGTRPFLTQQRMLGVRRRNSRPNADVVVFEEIPYVVDGHHKARRALDGSAELKARVLYTSDKSVGLKLQRMRTDFISDLPIRS